MKVICPFSFTHFSFESAEGRHRHRRLEAPEMTMSIVPWFNCKSPHHEVQILWSVWLFFWLSYLWPFLFFLLFLNTHTRRTDTFQQVTPPTDGQRQ